MKKFLFALVFLFCSVVCTFSFSACDNGSAASPQTSGSFPLNINDKYIDSDSVRSGSERSYIIFYEDGTGHYYNMESPYTIVFKYETGSESTVACFYDSVIRDGGISRVDIRWLEIFDCYGNFIVQHGGSAAYIAESYLDKIPNYGVSD